ncbi:MAG: 3-dehydroquinate synthase [Chloroflexi bacterium]|nr:3-dehydroquinate synthase [Chloroflexota bacterium]
MIFLYGPPGSGKTTIGKLLAQSLGIPFTDLDDLIVYQAGQSIPDIFDKEGESGFRIREKKALQFAVGGGEQVIALGGGALLDHENRALAESCGSVVCLDASFDELLKRMEGDEGSRPLLDGEKASLLKTLLDQRKGHYQSFSIHISTQELNVKELLREIQIYLGRFRISGMGKPYDVLIESQNLAGLGEALRKHALSSSIGVVSDRNVAEYYLHTVLKSLKDAGFEYFKVVLPAGEETKNIKNVEKLWKVWLSHNLERSGTIIALGGGVIGDIAGFAAATYLRGINWVVVPTSLLAMADSSLGGKTGVDTPQGKNLVGAFHSPRLVITDPETLYTLPVDELRSGMAEIVKAGLIGDKRLFNICRRGWEAINQDICLVVKRAASVKIQIIQEDPYEKNIRAVLNTGHTIGHAIEKASEYRIRHGEAVSIGMVIEARLAQKLGMAEESLAEQISQCLKNLDLPTEVPAGIDKEVLFEAMQYDKKRASGKIKFALPINIGKVEPGVIIDDKQLIFSVI